MKKKICCLITAIFILVCMSIVVHATVQNSADDYRYNHINLCEHEYIDTFDSDVHERLENMLSDLSSYAEAGLVEFELVEHPDGTIEVNIYTDASDSLFRSDVEVIEYHEASLIEIESTTIEAMSPCCFDWSNHRRVLVTGPRITVGSMRVCYRQWSQWDVFCGTCNRHLTEGVPFQVEHYHTWRIEGALEICTVCRLSRLRPLSSCAYEVSEDSTNTSYTNEEVEPNHIDWINIDDPFLLSRLQYLETYIEDGIYEIKYFIYPDGSLSVEIVTHPDSYSYDAEELLYATAAMNPCCLTGVFFISFRSESGPFYVRSQSLCYYRLRSRWYYYCAICRRLLSRGLPYYEGPVHHSSWRIDLSGWAICNRCGFRRSLS